MALTARSLLEGRDRPIVARPEEPLTGAIELMLEHDYTQLPVVDEQFRLKGIVTSDSILRALDAFGVTPAPLKVADATIKTRFFDPDGDVTELLDGLRDQYAAVIVDADDKVLGVVTNFDASEYFRRRAEDMMVVEDIEMTIRDHVLRAYAGDDGKVNQRKLDSIIARTPGSGSYVRERLKPFLAAYNTLRREQPVASDDELIEKAFEATFTESSVKSFDKLTLTNYIDLLLHGSVWSDYQPVFGVEKDAFRRLLFDVRNTRNELAHFRGDISARARKNLRFCAAWLDRHPPRVIAPPAALVTPALRSAQGVAAETASLTVIEEEPEPGESRYAKLATWLQEQSPATHSVSTAFGDIEKRIGHKLPPSATSHRAWWANDSVGHAQSRLWLEVGWRVANVSFADQRVTFERMEDRERAYRLFFGNLVARLTESGLFPKTYSPTGVSWHPFFKWPTGRATEALLLCSFARRNRVRVELYIDTQERDRNKAIFDGLQAERHAIESSLGAALSWEPLDTRRACRVAIHRNGSITDSREIWPELMEWAGAELERFYRTFDHRLKILLNVSDADGRR